MDRAGILRWNERTKAVSGLCFNLGGALLAAVVVRLFNLASIDLEAALWLMTMAVLFWIAYMLLGLLEPEDAE
ncbi:MAG: hypothetical protein WDN24_05350 [Sphingomonas sp.]